jgi:putative ABC transport system permease protein
VQTVEGIREDTARMGKSKLRVDGVNPELAKVFHYTWKSGSSDATLASLSGNGAIVLETYAKDNHLKVGSNITLTNQAGGKSNYQVIGIQAPAKLNPLWLGDVTIGNSAFGKHFKAQGDRFAFIKGGNLSDLEKALAGYPDTKVTTSGTFVDDQVAFLSDLLAILYVMLAFSVIVSLFGIVNTLALSVVERTREIGMLRAVGMTRRQTRRMVRHESIVTALIGAALGAMVGLFLGAMTVQALHGEGLRFTLPVSTLIAFVVVSVVAGTLAAIMPARRAAKLDVLNALQHV